MADKDDLREAGAEALKKTQTVLTTSDEEHKTVSNPSPTTAAGALAESKEAEEEESLELQTEPTPEEADEIRAQKKRKVAQVLQRGILNSKLQAVYDACVPEGRKGKFIRGDDESFIRYSNLYYSRTFTDGALERYGSVDGRIRVGDIELVTISDDDREILREVKQDRIMKNLGKGRKEYTAKADQAAREGNAPVPFDESILKVN